MMFAVIITLVCSKLVNDMYRFCWIQSSCCSARTAPTRRITASRFGKIPTTSVRRRISRLSLSVGLFDQVLLQSWGSRKSDVK